MNKKFLIALNEIPKTIKEEIDEKLRTDTIKNVCLYLQEDKNLFNEYTFNSLYNFLSRYKRKYLDTRLVRRTVNGVEGVDNSDLISPMETWSELVKYQIARVNEFQLKYKKNTSGSTPKSRIEYAISKELELLYKFLDKYTVHALETGLVPRLPKEYSVKSTTKTSFTSGEMLTNKASITAQKLDDATVEALSIIDAHLNKDGAVYTTKENE